MLHSYFVGFKSIKGIFIMSKRNIMRKELFPEDTRAILAQTSTPSPIEGFFAGLRSVAHRVETDVANMGQQIEQLQINPNHCDDGGMQAKHYMLLARKEMKNLKSTLRDLHEDLKMRSSTVVKASELFTSLLESYSDRLESVETYMEQYGYERPELLIEEEESLTDNASEHHVFESIENSISTNRPRSENDSSSFITPPASVNKGRKENILRTPRLQDFGLSEYTLSLYTQNHVTEQSNAKVHQPEKATTIDSGTMYQIKQHGNLPVVCNNSDENQTPVCSELTEVSNVKSSGHTIGMNTPQPEDFGLTDHILLQERQKIDFEKTVFLGGGDQTLIDTDSRYYKYKRPQSARKNLNITHFQNDCEAENIFSEKQKDIDVVPPSEDPGKENIRCEQSPKTPEMPTLSSTLWEAGYYSSTQQVETMLSSTDLLQGTPECQKLDTHIVEQSILPNEVSLSDGGVCQTPPLPILSSFK